MARGINRDDTLAVFDRGKRGVGKRKSEEGRKERGKSERERERGEVRKKPRMTKLERMIEVMMPRSH